MNNSGYLFLHQKEEKNEAKRKAKIFTLGLNEQRKLEKQRKLIDEKFEVLNDMKIQHAKNERIAKEDEERKWFRRRFEDASKINDIRINHYLSNYYLPPEEKELRNIVSSNRIESESSSKRRAGIVLGHNPNQRNDMQISYDHPENYYSYHPQKKRMLNKEQENPPGLYEDYH